MHLPPGHCASVSHSPIGAPPVPLLAVPLPAAPVLSVPLVEEPFAPLPPAPEAPAPSIDSTFDPHASSAADARRPIGQVKCSCSSFAVSRAAWQAARQRLG